MKFLPSSSSEINRHSIFWALFSQTIWLPVFIAAAPQGDKSAKNQTFYSDKALSSPQNFSLRSTQSANQLPPLQSAGIIATGRRPASSQTTGLLLNPFLSQPRPHDTDEAVPSNGPLASLPTLSSRSTQATSNFTPQPSTSAHLNSPISGLNSTAEGAPGRRKTGSSLLLQGLYSQSELLGGALSLQDLNEPAMPPLARAQRAQWSRSGDPLAALPELWREPMRRALSSLTMGGSTTKRATQVPGQGPLTVESARLIHVPSTKLRQSKEIALALQADGSVDILNQPDDPAVIEEINQWSSKQKPPAVGTMRPAVVHLHPLPSASVVRPVAVNAAEVEQPPVITPPPTPEVSSPGAPQMPQPATTSVSVTPAPANQVDQGATSEGGS